MGERRRKCLGKIEKPCNEIQKVATKLNHAVTAVQKTLETNQWCVNTNKILSEHRVTEQRDEIVRDKMTDV